MVVLFSRILMSASTSAQASQTAPWDYNVEAKAKFPLPPYPQEDNYEDPVLYKADCKRYQESKLKVLDAWDAWREQEQVADLAHAATVAREQAEAEKCWCEARGKALAQADEGAVPTAAHPVKKHCRAVLSIHPESSHTEGESLGGPAPGPSCQHCSQKCGFWTFCS